MTTISALRTGYVDHYLHLTSGASTRPWTSTEIEVHIQEALDALWRDGLGLRTSGSVTTDPDTDVYTLPTGMLSIRRIDLLDANGNTVDRVSEFRVLWDDETPASFIVSPLLASGYTMRVLGYKAMSRDASDLPQELESPVARAAASLCWTSLAGELLNSRRQQNEDTGRSVDYQAAIQNADYQLAAYRSAVAQSRYLRRMDAVSAYR